MIRIAPKTMWVCFGCKTKSSWLVFNFCCTSRKTTFYSTSGGHTTSVLEPP